MFKKVVTSVKTAWHTAVEEFEQDKTNSNKVLDDITNSTPNDQQEQQEHHHQIHRRYGSRHNLLKRKATLNSDLESLSISSKQRHKRRRFFSDLKKSASRETLSKRSNLSISAALPITGASDPDLADDVRSVATTTTVAASTAPDQASLSSVSSTTVEELKIRIYELETLVAQKDQIIKILREELTSQHSKKSGASGALAAVTEAIDQTGNIANNSTNNDNNTQDDDNNSNNNNSRLDKSDNAMNGFRTNTLINNNNTMTSPQNFYHSRPMSNVSVDGRFDSIIDRSYYNHPITATTSIASTMTPNFHHRTSTSSRRGDVSFEVLSPIAIDLDKFISTNDPRSARAPSAAAGLAAQLEQESQVQSIGNH